MTFNEGDRVRITDNAGLSSKGWTGLTATVAKRPSWIRPDGTYIRLDKGLRRGDRIDGGGPFVWNTDSLALIEEPVETSSFEFVEPVEGKVTLTLSMKDAEILTRALGKTNTGNLSQYSPVLLDFVERMVKHFGRDLEGEAANYRALTFNGQVYIEEVKD